MKNIIYIVFFLVSIVANSQTKETDYFRFYKGGEKYLKPIKYVLFDSLASNTVRKKDKQRICFYIDRNRFVHKKNYKIDTCSINVLQKIKLENPDNLQENVYNYFKNKKEEVEKKTNNKAYVLPPTTGFYPYFKVYILERTKDDKLLKYEVDWEYSSF
jgi:hypothetical protein